jgi:hypothetical protein
MRFASSFETFATNAMDEKEVSMIEPLTAL